jgi:hypothetical protein
MSKLSWYWHRLRAMSAAEIALHARKKARQFVDARRERDWGSVKLESGVGFPKIPAAGDAPQVLREALARDAENILHGRWRAFRELELRVDDPPRWHKDYLANVDLATNESAFKLNHRGLPKGADVKLIWELSRWNQLVRLAMAAHVLDDERAAHKCITWLEDWVKHNPPFRGWNWTSSLESGLRLVQFTWIDALLAPHAERWGFEAELETLRYEILPPHVWFTWRHKSFGSSANNHLLGELSGLILATARWPALVNWGANMTLLHGLWEREVFRQFAEDGGNKEQALNYQLFSFEFCWQVYQTLLAAHRTISQTVQMRLMDATVFFWNVQWNGARWAYGDSDDAYVTPFFLEEQHATKEWRDWFSSKSSSALKYWLGEFPDERTGFSPPAHSPQLGPWWHYQRSGIAVAESGFWWLRWDVSPLGYLATAAHGHLDALHLSVWFKGVPFIVDPGTGAYYADKNLRAWLASRSAHNSPCPEGVEFPRRLGPFLWAQPHLDPVLHDDMTAGLNLPGVQVRRQVLHSPAELEWAADDSATAQEGTPANFSVRWQFAPRTIVKRLGARSFVLKNGDAAIRLNVSDDWAEVFLVEAKGDEVEQKLLTLASTSSLEREFAGTVSPSFRRTEWAPYLKLIARPQPGQSCVFRTTFVASGAS